MALWKGSAACRSDAQCLTEFSWCWAEWVNRFGDSPFEPYAFVGCLVHSKPVNTSIHGRLGDDTQFLPLHGTSKGTRYHRCNFNKVKIPRCCSAWNLWLSPRWGPKIHRLMIYPPHIMDFHNATEVVEDLDESRLTYRKWVLTFSVSQAR